MTHIYLHSHEPQSIKIEVWRQIFKRKFPSLEARLSTNLDEALFNKIDFIIHFPYASPLDYSLFPSLKAVASPSPSVHHILSSNPTLLDQIPILRFRHPLLGQYAADYAHMHVLFINLNMHQYQENQNQRIWKAYRPGYIERIGVLGMGDIGSSVAHRLFDAGFKVCAWRRQHPDPSSSIPIFSGPEGLRSTLKSCNFIINCLPLTEETKHLLDFHKLSLLPLRSCIMSLGQGGVLVEDDLIKSLNVGHLAHAYLDTYETEPLPKESPLWAHKRIHMTPHSTIPYMPDLLCDSLGKNFHQILNNTLPDDAIDAHLRY